MHKGAEKTHTVCMKEGKDRSKSASELAWELFEKTGNYSYYMLYKRLK